MEASEGRNKRSSRFSVSQLEGVWIAELVLGINIDIDSTLRPLHLDLSLDHQPLVAKLCCDSYGVPLKC